MNDSGKNTPSFVIDHELVSDIIRNPSKHQSEIEAVIKASTSPEVRLVDSDMGRYYLQHLMMSARYYYLMKDFFWTHKLKAQETPQLTFFILSGLYKALEICEVETEALEGMRGLLKKHSGLDVVMFTVARKMGATIISNRDTVHKNALGIDVVGSVEFLSSIR
ncbi:hypothetical protein EF808_06060 [archaeon]|nr:MAG: hypothetical protein EF808_06060 [archaeon]